MNCSTIHWATTLSAIFVLHAYFQTPMAWHGMALCVENKIREIKSLILIQMPLDVNARFITQLQDVFFCWSLKNDITCNVVNGQNVILRKNNEQKNETTETSCKHARYIKIQEQQQADKRYFLLSLLVRHSCYCYVQNIIIRIYLFDMILYSR